MPASEGDRTTSTSGRAQGAYALVLLTAVTFFYQLDRNVMYVTQELIKREFHLTDTQIGLVAGLAYGAANGLAGIPMGWLVDRFHRARLLGACVAVWSAMTAMCGLTNGFGALFLARTAVGATEAAGQPASMGLVSDIFPPEKRASRMGVVSCGFSIGTIVSTLIGAYVADRHGWRAAFFVYGAPGVLLGLLMIFTLQEPRRASARATPPVPAAELPRAIGSLLLTPGLRMIYLATTLTSLTATGLFSWWTSFMLRVHKLDLTTVGVISTVALGLFAIGGNIATGHVSDWARRRSAGGALMVVCATTLVSLVFAAMAIWSPSTAGMVVALCLAGATLGSYIVPRSAAISELAPPHLMGLAFTLPVVIANLIGVSLGPVFVGAISDFSAHALPGVEPLRVAMTSVLLLQLPTALLYLLAARGLDQRAAARALSPQPAA